MQQIIEVNLDTNGQSPGGANTAELVAHPFLVAGNLAVGAAVAWSMPRRRVRPERALHAPVVLATDVASRPAGSFRDAWRPSQQEQA